jgi:hypothetical protein
MLNVFTIRLRGWKQTTFVILVLLGLAIGYSAFFQNGLDAQLPAIMKARLKIDLTSEAARRALVQRNDPQAFVSREQAKDYFEQHKAIEGLEVHAIEKRGWGQTVVARITYGFDYYDAQYVRYYRLKYDWAYGWHVWSQVPEYSYRTGWL